MKILTYNLWHGLDGQGWLRMGELEPSSRKKIRQNMQIKELLAQEWDVACLQEVDPLPGRAEVLAKACEAQAYWQSDSAGVKVGGQGLPTNVHSGLCTLMRGLTSSRVQSVKLSGTFTLITGWFSWQLSESRYALLCDCLHPDWGRVLVVNTHLHHGIEPDAQLYQALKALLKEAGQEEKVWPELEERLLAGEKRRREELSLLLRVIEKLKPRYGLIVLAGDLNARPESSLCQNMARAGFQDLCLQNSELARAFTWNPPCNKANSVFAQYFKLPLALEDLSFSDPLKVKAKQALRSHDQKPRRIDYIWAWSSQKEVEVVDGGLLGTQLQGGMAPSDHFGLWLDIQMVKQQSCKVGEADHL